VTSDLLGLDWDVEIAPNQNLRLVIYDSRQSRVEKLTILSDSLTSRDWTPGSLDNMSDHLLKYWAEGTSCPTNILDEFVLMKFPLSRSEFVKRAWKRPETTHPWDLNKFRTQLMLYMSPKLREFKEVEEAKLDPKEFDAFKSMISASSLNLDISAMVGQALTSWADIMEEEDEGNGLPIINGVDEDRISHLVKLFSGVQDEPEILFEDKDFRRTMPSSQQFFSSLELLCNTQQGCSLEMLVAESTEKINMKVKGVLGKVVSIILDRWVYDSDIDGMRDASRWESESIAVSDSIIAEEDLASIPSDLIDSNIETIEKELVTADGVVRASLMSTLNRYMRVKMMRSSKEEASDRISKEDFIKDTVKVMLESGKLDKEDYPRSTKHWALLFSDALSQFVSKMLDRKEISSLESQRFLVSIRISVLSTKFRELVSLFQDQASFKE